MHLARTASALTAVVLSAVLWVPSLAAANISTEPRLEDPLTGVLTLIIINFGTDLFLIAAAVYGAFYFTRGRMGDTAGDMQALVASVVLAGAVVAVAGGVIDFALLYERADDHYVLKAFSLPSVLVAAALIYATVAVSLRLVVRARVTVSLAAAAFIAPLSPIGWFMMSLATGSYVAFWLILFMASSWALAAVALMLLHYIQTRSSSGDLDRACEGGTP
jgi:hypothetical protein